MVLMIKSMVQKMSTILLDYFEIKYNLGAEIGCFLFMKVSKSVEQYTPLKKCILIRHSFYITIIQAKS